MTDPSGWPTSITVNGREFVPASDRDRLAAENAKLREALEEAARIAALEGVTASGQAEEAESDSPSMLYHEGRADAAASIIAAIRAKAQEVQS
jgi:hypothetical protein